MTSRSASEPEKCSEPALDEGKLPVVEPAKHRDDPSDRLGLATFRRLRQEHAVDGRLAGAGDREQHEGGRRDRPPLDARNCFDGEVRRLSELRLGETGRRTGAANCAADR